MSFVERVPCLTAAEFMNAISANGPHFQRDDPHAWIFRGHSDDSYQLVPSALRENNNKLWTLAGDELQTNKQQINAERACLFEFFHRTDKSGLPIPEDSQQLRTHVERLVLERYSDNEALRSGKKMWPPDELLSLLGLAQHYGFPTRLLDWTHHSGKAAHFAAVDAAEKSDSLVCDGKTADGLNLAVWAISPDGLRAHLQLEKVAGRDVELLTVSAPRAGNPNLHAQEGLFTLYRPERQYRSEPVDRRPLNEVLHAVETTRKIGTSKQPLLYRFTLPIAESARLLYMLAKEGIDGATLFPSYDGVVKAVFERRFWDRG